MYNFQKFSHTLKNKFQKGMDKKMKYINKNNRKEVIINIVGIIVLTGLILISGAMSQEKQTVETGVPLQQTSHQPQIASEVLRFHVIANSDSEEDQSLKLKVKEAVLTSLRPKLANAKTAKEAEEIIASNMEEIQLVADEVIASEGYTYKSKGVLGKTAFPVKQYGDMIFPAGEYEAFRILLGEAEGKNWWCVMFPTLCYVDETYDVITEENKEQFKEILTEEEYESLFMEENKEENMDESTKEARFFYKLKTAVWMNKVIDYFSK